MYIEEVSYVTITNRMCGKLAQSNTDSLAMVDTLSEKRNTAFIATP